MSNTLSFESLQENTWQNPNVEVLEFAHMLIESTGSNLFVTGKAGSGKTYFLNQEAKRTTKRHLILAPTGIAAVNAGGLTINSLFQIPPGTYVPQIVKQVTDVYTISGLIANLNYTLEKRNLIQSLELIFIDEVSMLRSDQLSLIDAILKKVRNSTLPFGGIQMVFIGDLFQLPPVLPSDLARFYGMHYRSEFFFDSDVIKTSPLIQLELPFVHRQSDQTFINLLNRVRTNQLTQADLAKLNEQVDNKNDERLAIHITSHIESATEINNTKLKALPGEERQYPAIITGDFKEANISAERMLKLKKGAQVMIIRNDAKSLKDYYNGKTGEVLQMNDNGIVVRFEDGKEFEIERATWQSIDYVSTVDEVSVNGELKQFPIKLAWAVTIHKSQGLTFDCAVIDAAKSFAPGQVYVALSRVRSFEGLRLKTELTSDSIRTNPVISEYLDLTPLVDFEKVLKDSKISYWLNQLLNQFDVSTQHDQIIEILNKPNTYKQKIATPILISFQDAEDALKKLKSVWENFSTDIFNNFYPSIDQAQLEGRIIKGSEYFSGILTSLIAQLSDKATGKNDLSVELIRNINASLNKRLEEINKTKHWLSLFKSKGIDIAILESRARDTAVVSPTADKTARGKRRNTNNSAVQTIDLFLSGSTIDEISKARNLSAATVENHLLEAAKNGQPIAVALLEATDLQAIQNKILEIGSGVLDLKEFFGDKYTFFQIRLAINHARFVGKHQE